MSDRSPARGVRAYVGLGANVGDAPATLAWAIEALAAVGQVERATAVVDKILNFESSPETKGELQKYAERAGNAAVIQYLQGK